MQSEGSIGGGVDQFRGIWRQGGQAIAEAVPVRVVDTVLKVTFLLIAEGFTIADEKLEIPRVRRVHCGEIDLIRNAVAESEPDPAARMIRGAESFLGTGGPAWFNARSAEGGMSVDGVHAKIILRGSSLPSQWGFAGQHGLSLQPVCLIITIHIATTLLDVIGSGRHVSVKKHDGIRWLWWCRCGGLDFLGFHGLYVVFVCLLDGGLVLMADATVGGLRLGAEGLEYVLLESH